MGVSLSSFAVVDLETTGFGSQHEVVEIAVVDFDAEAGPRLALDSLIRPERRIPNHSIHGISNRDVRRAPAFEHLAGAICDVLAGKVVVAHNAQFDLRFLVNRLATVGGPSELPFACTMEMAASLKGDRADLETACRSFGIDLTGRQLHRASVDAMATAELFVAMLGTDAADARIMDRLAGLAPKTLGASRDVPPIPDDLGRGLIERQPPYPRPNRAISRPVDRPKTASYEVELTRAIRSKKRSFAGEIGGLGSAMDPEKRAAIHARVFGAWLSTLGAGGVISAGQADRIREVAVELSRLGWAPGE